MKKFATTAIVTGLLHALLSGLVVARTSKSEILPSVQRCADVMFPQVPMAEGRGGGNGVPEPTCSRLDSAGRDRGDNKFFFPRSKEEHPDTVGGGAVSNVITHGKIQKCGSDPHDPVTNDHIISNHTLMILPTSWEGGHNSQFPSHGMLTNTWCGDVPSTGPTPHSQRRVSFPLRRQCHICSLRPNKDLHSHFISDVVKTRKIDSIIGVITFENYYTFLFTESTAMPMLSSPVAFKAVQFFLETLASIDGSEISAMEFFSMDNNIFVSKLAASDVTSIPSMAGITQSVQGWKSIIRTIGFETPTGTNNLRNLVTGWTKDKDKVEIPERKRVLKALEAWDTESDPSEKSYMLGMKALARSFTNIESFISEKEPLASALIEMWRSLKASNTAIGTVKTRTATRTVTIAQGQEECSTATERATQLRSAVNSFFKKLPEPTRTSDDWGNLQSENQN